MAAACLLACDPFAHADVDTRWISIHRTGFAHVALRGDRFRSLMAHELPPVFPDSATVGVGPVRTSSTAGVACAPSEPRAQHSTAQHSTAQHSTAQHSTASMTTETRRPRQRGAGGESNRVRHCTSEAPRRRRQEGEQACGSAQSWRMPAPERWRQHALQRPDHHQNFPVPGEGDAAVVRRLDASRAPNGFISDPQGGDGFAARVSRRDVQLAGCPPRPKRAGTATGQDEV